MEFCGTTITTKVHNLWQITRKNSQYTNKQDVMNAQFFLRHTNSKTVLVQNFWGMGNTFLLHLGISGCPYLYVKPRLKKKKNQCIQRDYTGQRGKGFSMELVHRLSMLNTCFSKDKLLFLLCSMRVCSIKDFRNRVLTIATPSNNRGSKTKCMTGRRHPFSKFNHRSV